MTDIDNSRLIWIDLEMTGLDTLSDHIIEIATVVTDKDLRILAEGPVLAIRHPESILAAMDEWNQRHHGASGLVQRVLNSQITMAMAEQQTLDFLSHWLEKGQSPMCGNSICQDRRFLSRQMPALERFFHYRNLDVSTVKELARRWAPKVMLGLHKNTSHQALDDVHDSINELIHYRQHFMRVEA
ncbi:MAG: oligoribonuclease [Steroidobacteraceae bacterium]